MGLTPSYSGTVNKDYWRGSSRSRNADSLDPFTLSNTLPLPRNLHAQAMPHLNDLRARISQAKRPAAATPTARAVDSGSLAGELAHLAALRESGILTDEEFAAAKARLLGAARCAPRSLPPGRVDWRGSVTRSA